MFKLSAEKEIINYWLNLQNFFTISNVKVKNKDIGILALKFDKEVVKEALHLEISCSISGNMETGLESINKFVDDKFFDNVIRKKIDSYTKSAKLKNMLVLGTLPKSRKKEIINAFKKKEIEVIEFEDIISSVIMNLDTQYYRNDVIRTLQLLKYLLLSNPQKLAGLISSKSDILNTNTRGKFLNELLKLELIQKEFTKTDEEQIVSVLKYSTLRKPEKLAELLEKDVLNRRTRKPFLNSLLEQEKMRKLYVKTKKKTEKPLNHFFK